MLQENIVKNDTMCDLLCYCFIVKLQNFLIAPRIPFFKQLLHRSDPSPDFDGRWLKRRGLTQGCALLGIR